MLLLLPGAHCDFFVRLRRIYRVGHDRGWQRYQNGRAQKKGRVKMTSGRYAIDRSTVQVEGICWKSCMTFEGRATGQAPIS